MSAVLTVSELTGYIQAVLSRMICWLLCRCAVSCLISSTTAAGICISLKDGGATLRCVMFRRHADQPRFAQRTVWVWPLAGWAFTCVTAHQLYADYLQADGTGELYAALERLKSSCKEGLFARTKRPSYLPRAGSDPAAALPGDIIHVAQRHPGVPLILVPVAVQGVNAAQEINAGIRPASAPVPVDVMIGARWVFRGIVAFNEEAVVRAIAASEIPVISAVGTTDFTLADLAADVRAATPSAAAELAVPEYAVEMSRLQEMAGSTAALVKWWKADGERLHLGMAGGPTFVRR